ncbi:unnamed protein product [Cylicocyclus nassatus]|uniref:Uncharacterized protein n=1 Tax=Cylicocyclus nassatus TaxID=53992 RepID=A0AA36GEM1_CYLNA|nr:unnamed protein product [Cylicocyclus nassatus]
MVLRPSSSSWSIAPETIMSHHYKLTRGVKGRVDTSPPFSMYNSPISVHYIPKRASSADAAKRRQPKLSRPHKELSEFVGDPYGRGVPKLNLPLSLTGNDVKSKLLQTKTYQPPLHRNRQVAKPPAPKAEKNLEEKKKRAEKQRRKENFCFDLFKDAVYTYVIDREVFTDGVIAEAVDIEMEKWSNQISWDDLECLRAEIFDELGVRPTHYTPKQTRTENKSKSKSSPKRKSRSSTGSTESSSSSPHSSGSALSELKTDSDRSEAKSNSERVSESESESSSSSSSGKSEASNRSRKNSSSSGSSTSSESK